MYVKVYSESAFECLKYNCEVLMKDALEEDKEEKQIDKFDFAAVAQRDDLLIAFFTNMFTYTKDSKL